jgi:hypothetical protein
MSGWDTIRKRMQAKLIYPSETLVRPGEMIVDFDGSWV